MVESHKNTKDPAGIPAVDETTVTHRCQPHPQGGTHIKGRGPPWPPWAKTQTKTATTHCDAAESRRLLAKPLQEPLPQRDAYHSRNLRKQARGTV